MASWCFFSGHMKRHFIDIYCKPITFEATSTLKICQKNANKYHWFIEFQRNVHIYLAFIGRKWYGWKEQNVPDECWNVEMKHVLKTHLISSIYAMHINICAIVLRQVCGGMPYASLFLFEIHIFCLLDSESELKIFSRIFHHVNIPTQWWTSWYGKAEQWNKLEHVRAPAIIYCGYCWQQPIYLINAKLFPFLFPNQI